MSRRRITGPRRCTRCGLSEPEVTFQRDRRGYLKQSCRACMARYRKAYYQAHRAHAIEHARRWAASHPERRQAIQRRYDAKRPARPAGLPPEQRGAYWRAANARRRARQRKEREP